MRKFCLIIAMLFVAIAAKAIPLFPFFCDIAGDYNDGCPDALVALGITCSCYVEGPNSFTKDAKEANEFLNDVLPYSSYPISKEEREVNGATITQYTSPMTGGYVSEIYVVTTADGTYYRAYIEKEEKGSTGGGYFGDSPMTEPNE